MTLARWLQVMILAFAGGVGASAAADCPTANQYSFTYATAPAATLSYTGTSTYTATNSAGQSQSFTVSFTTNGVTSSVVGGAQMPAINNLINDGGTTNNNLMIGAVFAGRTPSITGTSNVVATTLAFATPIRDLAVQINDIDFTGNQYRDWIYISGANGGSTYTPVITTPWGTDNGAGAKTNASSSFALGPAATPFNQSANEGVGTSNSVNNSNTGTLTATFPQPVTSVTLRYGNYALQAGETATGQQAYGIQTVTFCPMPSLTLAKTNAPWSDPQNGTNNSKLIPGADLIYTLTVSNSNSSPVDMSTTVLTDPLPAGVVFYNGDIDDSGPATTNYAFNAGTSGLSFSPSGLSYSNNGGTNYGYSPTAGYDTAVNALRFAPVGTMAANSSFSIQFRARIK